MTNEIKGFVAKGFEPIAQIFQKNLDEGLELGASFCAQIEGETIIDIYGGYSDRARQNPWAADTLVPIYSTTKPIAAIIIARIQDMGLLHLDDPIGTLWPEFPQNDKSVSIAMAMSHQAGVPGFINPIDPALWLDPPKLAAELAKLAPMWKVGTQSGYHPLTFGYILGELAMRAEGRTLGTHLRHDICLPLEIDFWIGLPDSEHERCAQIERPKSLPNLGEINEMRKAAFLTPWSAPNRGTAEWRRAEIPSANGHGTANSVASLYGVFANDGKINGKEILSNDALNSLTQERIKGQDLVLPSNLQWAAGILINNNLVYGPNPNAIGHSGWGGSCAFADASKRLSAAYIMNKQSNSLMGDTRAKDLIDALYSCLSRNFAFK